MLSGHNYTNFSLIIQIPQKHNNYSIFIYFSYAEAFLLLFGRVSFDPADLYKVFVTVTTLSHRSNNTSSTIQPSVDTLFMCTRS